MVGSVRRAIVRVEKDQLASARRIQCLERDCCEQRTDKGAPKDLAGEVCCNFFVRKEYTADGRTKSDGKTTRTAGRQHFAELAPILPLLGEPHPDQVCNAC